MTIDLLTHMRDADPARGVHDYDDASLVELAWKIASTSPAARVHPTRHSRGRSRRLFVVVPIAAAIAAAFVVVPVLTGGPGVSAEAATLLNKAADSITTADPPTKPGQWWKVTTKGSSQAVIGTSQADPDERVVILQGSTRTDYVSIDGSRPTVTVDGPVTFLKQLAGETVTAEDFPDEFNGTTAMWTTNLSPNEIPGSWQTPNADFLAELPRETEQLRMRLYDDTAGHGRSTNGEVFVYIADVLRTGLVPADLRASLYRVMATVPGVEITSQKASIGDHNGVAFGWYESVDGTRQEIIVDPTTGELVGERQVQMTSADGITAGTVVYQTRSIRRLVDAVPSEVARSARVDSCTVQDGGAVMCADPNE